MSTYEEICKRRCKWCARKITGHWDVMNQQERTCTAPTYDQVIEEQTTEITRLLALISCIKHEDWCPAGEVKAACDALPEDECEWLVSFCVTHTKHKFVCNCIKSKAVES